MYKSGISRGEFRVREIFAIRFHVVQFYAYGCFLFPEEKECETFRALVEVNNPRGPIARKPSSTRNHLTRSFVAHVWTELPQLPGVIEAADDQDGALGREQQDTYRPGPVNTRTEVSGAESKSLANGAELAGDMKRADDTRGRRPGSAPSRSRCVRSQKYHQ